MKKGASLPLSNTALEMLSIQPIRNTYMASPNL